jgi:cell wall-associated NlpC family hydrolase
MTTRSAICAEAVSWLGTPYHHHGDVKGVGVDCAMLLVRVYSAVGLTPPQLDPRPYAYDWHMHRSEERYLNTVMQFADQVDTPLPGDITLWRFGRAFSHAAIMTDGLGGIVHAYRDAGCVVRGSTTETTLIKREHVHYRVRGIQE